jgi:hypothetical protein
MELGTEYPAAERGQPIVAPAFIAQVRGRSMIGFGDESVVDKPLDDAVQVAGVENDQTVRALGDLLHEAVAVALVLGQREEKLEIDRLEREKVARVWGHDGFCGGL